MRKLLITALLLCLCGCGSGSSGNGASPYAGVWKGTWIETSPGVDGGTMTITIASGGSYTGVFTSTLVGTRNFGGTIAYSQAGSASATIAFNPPIAGSTQRFTPSFSPATPPYATMQGAIFYFNSATNAQQEQDSLTLAKQ